MKDWPQWSYDGLAGDVSHHSPAAHDVVRAWVAGNPDISRRVAGEWPEFVDALNALVVEHGYCGY